MWQFPSSTCSLTNTKMVVCWADGSSAERRTFSPGCFAASLLRCSLFSFLSFSEWSVIVRPPFSFFSEQLSLQQLESDRALKDSPTIQNVHTLYKGINAWKNLWIPLGLFQACQALSGFSSASDWTHIFTTRFFFEKKKNFQNNRLLYRQASTQAAFLRAVYAEVGPAAVSIGHRTIRKQPQNPANVLSCQLAACFHSAQSLPPVAAGGAALWAFLFRCVSGAAEWWAAPALFQTDPVNLDKCLQLLNHYCCYY